MKRILSLILCLCLVMTFLPATAMAAGSSSRDLTFELAEAEDLKELGLFLGTGTNADGSTNFDLARTPTRLEALVVLIRLLGKDAEAKACTEPCPFTDVPDWGKPYVAYAYKTGLTNGSGGGKFGMGNSDASMYLTFVLRALGYDDSAGDFVWNDNEELANQVGLLPEGVNTKNFWRADMVTIAYAAMYADVKGGAETLSERLIKQGVFTAAEFDTAMDERLLLANTIPELRIKGNWPCSEELLQQKWAELYPIYCRYLGLPTKILTEGITWEWDNSITPDTVGYYPATNSFKMGPLPQHRNFDDANHYDYEPMILQCMHETAHLFWQEGNSNLAFDFGQWAWEAAALVAEDMYRYEIYGEHSANSGRAFDLINLCGWDAINGVMNDGNKYNRTIENGSATIAFDYLCTVLSDEGTWNFFQKVNDLRMRYYEETGVLSVGYDAYLNMLDEAAGSRTIDGLKPSEWMRQLPVSNTDGATGDFLIVYPGRLIDDRASVNFAVWNRFVDGHGDKRETGFANQSVTVKVYDPAGKLVGSRTGTTRDQGEGDVEITLASGIKNDTALKIVATTTINGKTLTAINYHIYRGEGLPDNTADEQMYVILLDDNGDIVTNLKTSDIKVTGAAKVDTSSLSGGVLKLTVNTGDSVSIIAGGRTAIYSQPLGIRVVPFSVK